MQKLKIADNVNFSGRLSKLQNRFETQFVNQNSSIQGIAASLATNHVLLGNTNLINKEIDIYKSITREDLQNAAKISES